VEADFEAERSRTARDSGRADENKKKKVCFVFSFSAQLSHRVLQMFVVALLSLLVVAMATTTIRDLPVSEQEHVDAFEALRVAHARTYAPHSDEYATRFGVFKENVQRIRKTVRASERAKTFFFFVFFDESRLTVCLCTRARSLRFRRRRRLR
jgi:hypothetical protein